MNLLLEGLPGYQLSYAVYKSKLEVMPSHNCPFDHLLILDFETTSDGETHDYPFEVIQFSVVPYDVKAKTILAGLAFNKFVRPVVNPVLSKHCAEFTGIKQESLNSADTFLVVYKQFLEWLQKNGFQERQFAIVSDSRQDMWRIAQYQFRLVQETMPSMFRQWINIKRTFDDGLEDGQKNTLVGTSNMEKMTNYLGIESSGKAHDAFYTASMYGVCPYCKKPPTVCGAVHKQPPREFYASLTEPCVFAKSAGYY
ncbi:unnamed protein product [Caenorhabditis nigoni]